MKLLTERDFRRIPRLRLRRDPAETDELYQAYARSRLLRADHLYFNGPGILGLYYIRKSEKAATNARARWLKLCENPILGEGGGPWGEFDGIILFRPASPAAIPAPFFRAHRPAPAHGFRPGNRRGGPDTTQTTPPPEKTEKGAPK